MESTQKPEDKPANTSFKVAYQGMKSLTNSIKEKCENGINLNVDKKAKLNWNIKFMGEPATYEEWLTQFFEG